MCYIFIFCSCNHFHVHPEKLGLGSKHIGHPTSDPISAPWGFRGVALCISETTRECAGEHECRTAHGLRNFARRESRNLTSDAASNARYAHCTRMFRQGRSHQRPRPPHGLTSAYLGKGFDIGAGYIGYSNTQGNKRQLRMCLKPFLRVYIVQRQKEGGVRYCFLLGQLSCGKLRGTSGADQLREVG